MRLADIYYDVNSVFQVDIFERLNILGLTHSIDPIVCSFYIRPMIKFVIVIPIMFLSKASPNSTSNRNLYFGLASKFLFINVDNDSLLCTYRWESLPCYQAKTFEKTVAFQLSFIKYKFVLGVLSQLRQNSSWLSVQITHCVFVLTIGKVIRCCLIGDLHCGMNNIDTADLRSASILVMPLIHLSSLEDLGMHEMIIITFLGWYIIC